MKRSAVEVVPLHTYILLHIVLHQTSNPSNRDVVGLPSASLRFLRSSFLATVERRNPTRVLLSFVSLISLFLHLRTFSPKPPKTFLPFLEGQHCNRKLTCYSYLFFCPDPYGTCRTVRDCAKILHVYPVGRTHAQSLQPSETIVFNLFSDRIHRGSKNRCLPPDLVEIIHSNGAHVSPFILSVALLKNTAPRMKGPQNERPSVFSRAQHAFEEHSTENEGSSE